MQNTSKSWRINLTNTRAARKGLASVGKDKAELIELLAGLPNPNPHTQREGEREDYCEHFQSCWSGGLQLVKGARRSQHTSKSCKIDFITMITDPRT